MKQLIQIRLILLSLIFIIVAGCSSIAGHYVTWTDGDPGFYPGTKIDLNIINSNQRANDLPFSDPIYIALAYIDLPFSIIMDTVLLPIDAIVYGLSPSDSTTNDEE